MEVLICIRRTGEMYRQLGRVKRGGIIYCDTSSDANSRRLCFSLEQDLNQAALMV